MKGTFKFDSRKLQAGAAQLAILARKKPVVQVMRGVAGQVVRRVASVTPPSGDGVTGTAAKKRGEAAIAGDLAKIMVASRKPDARGAVTPREVYLRFRNPQSRSGRVNPRNLKNRFAVKGPELRGFVRDLQSLVGTLAGGWNAAAEELGVKLPAWVRRHGTKNGVIRIAVSNRGIRITMTNSVRFAKDVEGLRSRIQWAIDVVAKSILERQIPNAVKAVARSAGFKTR